MSRKALKVGVPTKGRKGLEDEVSQVFGRAEVFTIVEIEGGEVKGVEIIENPGASYEYGAGPIAVKALVDVGVNVVMASEFGPGAAGLLDQHGVSKVTVTPGTLVAEAIREIG